MVILIIVRYFIVLILIVFFQHISLAQSDWSWVEMANMPEPVTNNAVTFAESNSNPFVYSFSGIDSTKAYSGIHLRSFRYDVQADKWETIPSLPDTLGKIATGASTVKNKIYIIGGYHVYADNSEKSSNKLHIFDPDLNIYLPDGSDLPKQIDDHVQAVWRDSLIFVITGWSDNTNVSNVQIYNPTTDVWFWGKPVPNTTGYKVFGASGEIIGDTIYYAGGARTGSNFPLVSFLRKGIINPLSPDSITWTQENDSLALGYRMAVARSADNVIWIGGSAISYNYNGIAYDGSGGVDPVNRALIYNAANQLLYEETGDLPEIMDLRGMGKLGYGKFLIAGGMLTGQKVSNKTFLITNTEISTVEENSPRINIYPNPAGNYIFIDLGSRGAMFHIIKLIDLKGAVYLTESSDKGMLKLNVSELKNGLYFLQIKIGAKSIVKKIWIDK